MTPSILNQLIRATHAPIACQVGEEHLHLPRLQIASDELALASFDVLHCLNNPAMSNTLKQQASVRLNAAIQSYANVRAQGGAA